MSEVEAVAPRDRVLAADGAVAFLERVSPALENVDSSSGAIGTAVDNAIGVLVRIIAEAPADPATRDAWLERLWAAYEADQVQARRLVSAEVPGGFVTRVLARELGL